MKRFLTLLSVLGWLLIIYWGLPPSLFSLPTGVFFRGEPARVMPEERGNRKPSESTEQSLHTEAVAGVSRNLLQSSAGGPRR